MPLSPSQKASRTTWGNGLPTTPTAAYLVAEGISPTTGPGRERKEKCPGAVMMWYAPVRAMKLCGDPSQPTSNHRPITALHQSITFVLPKAIPLPWAYGPPYSLSCGGQVPDVGIPHYRDARMQHSQSGQPALPGVSTVVAPRGVPASTNEVFPASPT